MYRGGGMTKVKLSQNTRMACSRIFPSSFQRRASQGGFWGWLARSRAGTRAARPQGAAPSWATPAIAASRRDFRRLQFSLNVFSVILSWYNTITHRIWSYHLIIRSFYSAGVIKLIQLSEHVSSRLTCHESSRLSQFKVNIAQHRKNVICC